MYGNYNQVAYCFIIKRTNIIIIVCYAFQSSDLTNECAFEEWVVVTKLANIICSENKFNSK